MKRFLLYATTATVQLSMAFTAFRLTSNGPPAPACPRCGRLMIVTSHPDATADFCVDCQHNWNGPVRYDFSWWDAGEA